MRVLLVDDHRLMLEALSGLLAASGHEVVGAATDGCQGVALAESLSPDLILMDLRMPVCDGLAATRLIKASQPEARIVMLTTSAEDEDLFAAIRSGACGYLLKSIDGERFVEALRGLEAGVPPFSPGLAARVLEEFARLAADPTPEERPAAQEGPPGAGGEGGRVPALTERQSDVLRLVSAGLTYSEVGQELHIAERTVRYHMAEIMDRLHLEHRSQVIAWAGSHGLGRPPE